MYGSVLQTSSNKSLSRKPYFSVVLIDHFTFLAIFASIKCFSYHYVPYTDNKIEYACRSFYYSPIIDAIENFKFEIVAFEL